MTREEFRKLTEKGAVILDGATGTNLQKAGMPVGVCPEQWILEHPDIFVRLQKAYVEAGTQILFAPTFTANTIKLAEYGKSEYADSMNRELVALSKRAAEGKAYVAGDLTMTGKQLYPIGDLMFEELVGVYRDQARAILAAGADLFVVETMMSLQECRAAVIAVREVCDLPVMVSLTYQENGRTLYGTDPVTAIVTLQSLGADAVGLNCSTGPEAMRPLVEAMAGYATVPILAKPNAGLPELKDGETVYRMQPEEFAAAAAALVEAGAAIVGGCCGTTPKHIRALADAVAGMPLKKPLEKQRRVLTSERKSIEILPDGRFMVIGERINPTGKKKLQAQLKEGSLELVRSMAAEQEENGADILDINMGMNGIDEKEMMLSAVYEVTSTVDLPLCIDSSHIDIIEAALRIYPGRALINSISLEKEKADGLLPIAKKYGAMFILLPLSDDGLPEDSGEKRRIIRALIERAKEAGLSEEDIIVDGLVATVGANPSAALSCFETFDDCRKLGLPTVCGLSNISFGLPERSAVNAAFLTMAIAHGLTMAIANPSQELLMNAAYASDLLLCRPESDIRYIERMNEAAEKRETAERERAAAGAQAGRPDGRGEPAVCPDNAPGRQEAASCSQNEQEIARGTSACPKEGPGRQESRSDNVPGRQETAVRSQSEPEIARGTSAGSERGPSGQETAVRPDNVSGRGAAQDADVTKSAVYQAVLKGNKRGILDEVKAVLGEGEQPERILNGHLIPAISEVGELFERQKYFLPQLIASANAMETAIAYLEPMLERGDTEKKATIVIATVEGDIHDIGKNLVALMLRNYGYRVIDLGKDVPAERIVETAVAEHAKIIGLSALMTTTMMRMKEVVELVKEKGADCMVMIGGAAITESFAEEIGADGYSKDAAECVKLAERLLAGKEAQ